MASASEKKSMKAERREKMFSSLRIWGFTLSLSFVQLLNLLILTYFSANVNTIEKQFGFSSVRSGLIMASEDIAYVLLVLLVTYVGEKGHKPRILAVSAFCFSAASLMCILPYLIFGRVEIAAGSHELHEQFNASVTPFSPRRRDATLCFPEDQGTSNRNSDFFLNRRPLGFRPVELNRLAFGLFVIGFLLTGAGSTPINSLGLTYIDDSVKRTKSAFFMGIVNSVRVIGPVLGFSLGAAFSRIPVDLKAKDYGTRDPRWVGAWWAGFAVTSVAAILFGLPLMFFPRQMTKPITEEINGDHQNGNLLEKMDKTITKDEEKNKEEANRRPRRALILSKSNAKELPKVIGRLIQNPVYACLALSSCLDSLMIGGYYSFLAKYLRIHFNVPFWKAGLVAGIVNSVRVIGPVLGFSLGAAFSRIPVDLKAKDYGTRDPRWVGAWWAGFAVTSVAAILFGLPLMFFPRQMTKPITEEINGDHQNGNLLEKMDKTITKDEEKNKEEANRRPRRALILSKSNAKELPKVIGRLIQNPVYACLALSSCLDSLMIGGYHSFLAKYLRIHFNVPFWKAGLVAGWCGAAASSLGCFLGGFITSKWRMTPLQASKFAAIAAVISALLHGALSGVGCPQNPIAGITDLQNSSRSDWLSSCVTDCACPKGEYLPVCGDNGVSYTSPCQAGCQASAISNSTSARGKQKKIYTSCSCVDSDQPKARIGLCDKECPLTWYIVILLTSSVSLGLFSMPLCIVTLRCVGEKDRSMALGLGSFLANVLGFLPAPVITGLVVDSTCLLWSGAGGTGACSLYDKPRLRLYFHVVIAGYKLLGCIFKIVVVVLYSTGRVGQPDMVKTQVSEHLKNGETTHENHV